MASLLPMGGDASHSPERSRRLRVALFATATALLCTGLASGQDAALHDPAPHTATSPGASTRKGGNDDPPAYRYTNRSSHGQKPASTVKGDAGVQKPGTGARQTSAAPGKGNTGSGDRNEIIFVGGKNPAAKSAPKRATGTSPRSSPAELNPQPIPPGNGGP